MCAAVPANRLAKRIKVSRSQQGGKNTRDASEVLDNEGFHSSGLPKQRLNDRLPDGNLDDENSHEENPGPECFKVRIGDFAADVLSLSLFATDNQMQLFPALAHPYFKPLECFGSGSYAASLFYHEGHRRFLPGLAKTCFVWLVAVFDSESRRFDVLSKPDSLRPHFGFTQSSRFFGILSSIFKGR